MIWIFVILYLFAGFYISYKIDEAFYKDRPHLPVSDPNNFLVPFAIMVVWPMIVVVYSVALIFKLAKR